MTHQMAIYTDCNGKEYFYVELERTKSVVHSQEDFGVADNKGRAIGARVWVWTETYTETEEGENGYNRIQPVDKGLGLFYCLYPNALRAGEKFGAIGNTLKFRTEAERDAAIAKYYKGARARAMKTAAKTAA